MGEYMANTLLCPDVEDQDRLREGARRYEHHLPIVRLLDLPSRDPARRYLLDEVR
jgi:hypothetical protein